MKPVLTVENLSFTYDKKQVLEDVSFQVLENDFTVIIGPNGGGKSTLLKLILGLLKIQKGSVKILNNNIENAYKYIGYVPQDSEHIKNFPINVLDTVLMSFYKTHLTKKDQYLKAMEYLRIVNMSEYHDARLNELSTGQRQRVFIARALVKDPEILILDEPISGVDPKGQIQVLDIIKNFTNNGTVLFVSHNLEMIPKYATSVLCVDKNSFFHKKEEFGTDLEGRLILMYHERRSNA